MSNWKDDHKLPILIPKKAKEEAKASLDQSRFETKIPICGYV